jgi:hypothetical protein
MPSLVAPGAGKTGAGAQLKQPGTLPLRKCNGVEKACCGSGGISDDEQQIAAQPKRLGVQPFAVRDFGKTARLR